MNKFILPLAVAVASADIQLVTFDGVQDTTFSFKQLNDPVMGGRSSGNWAVNATGGYGIMKGSVVNVPALAAPGFIKAAAEGTFPDISAAADGNLVLNVRSTSSEYRGFRISIAVGSSTNYACSSGGTSPYSRGCFKTKFFVPPGRSFSPVRIPFTEFSDLWSPATGEHTAECEDDATACMTRATLSAITRVEFWAEGVAGDVDLEVQSVYAEESTKAAQVSASPPIEQNHCRGSVQNNLRFGVSGRDTAQGIPVLVNDNESLAEAVCCDNRMLPYAEPQFLFEAPDIALFSKMDANGVTSFYDSVCGAELFRAPVDRSMEDFQADTIEHGWPSFRMSEVNFDNVVTDKATGYVTSVCGTHLGSYLPDEEGPRWCIDLTCVSGNQ
jgi:peptide methionine sulfoxide reductase MsrB